MHARFGNEQVFAGVAQRELREELRVPRFRLDLKRGIGAPACCTDPRIGSHQGDDGLEIVGFEDVVVVDKDHDRSGGFPQASLACESQAELRLEDDARVRRCVETQQFAGWKVPRRVVDDQGLPSLRPEGL